MKNRLLLLVAAPLLLGARDRERAAWKEFSPQTGRFVVLIPDPPLRQMDLIRTAAGPVELVAYTVERKQEKTAYVVMCCGFARADHRLDEIRKRIAAAINGKLLSDRPIRRRGRLGRELLFEAEGQGMVRQRLFIIENTLYQLLVAGPRNQVVSEEADRFLDSFRLNPRG